MIYIRVASGPEKWHQLGIGVTPKPAACKKYTIS
eukprot:CAMPEP_0197631826 /NCGR_PEP_ID=MMETSP1338-20131121/8863_1 /TAXON_ID=43686 ORGANISM="Pelagodinium beii, Strain RCC1491" /NCGR_SAMPLE_ID=MMETSP1338 /ASSEMBLY_ACC=CAM_ASM_000754 /LENGTH=33 /DNA_ID= /DNA_START= /DNA_END= /DNA_ORIENTATION=